MLSLLPWTKLITEQLDISGSILVNSSQTDTRRADQAYNVNTPINVPVPVPA